MVSFDFGRDWYAEGSKGADAPYGDGGLADLGVAVTIPQVGSDDRFVAGHRGFSEGSSVVAGLDLPRLGTDFGDAADGAAPGRGCILFAWWWGNGRPGSRRNDGRRQDAEDGPAADYAVIALVRCLAAVQENA